MLRVFFFLFLHVILAGFAYSQAPLVVDNPSTTPPGKFHFEWFDQFAELPNSAEPANNQNTFVFTTNYGLLPNLELGMDFPLITISGQQNRTGVGDFDFTVKYILLPSTYPKKRTAFGMTASVEFPTGNSKENFGSGVTDFDMNMMLQIYCLQKLVLILNGGIQFTGNTLTGLVGTPDRGEVLSGGTSLTYQLSPRIAIAGELTGYQGRSHVFEDRELREQAALTYTFTPHFAVAVAIQHGTYATPPVQVQSGLIIDP
ncbi:MAG: hypothetical protein C5B54_11080 [Acidobacteria bacterium]|nr:MAG: hypothetical protein C5B54_11080 [Acidobacteriota bacterium]